MKESVFYRLKEHSRDNLGEGTDENLICKLEKAWDINLPQQYRGFIKEIGYAEIFGDELYSIYEVPDIIPCNGLFWMNSENEYLEEGYIQFFSNDIDGVFYINCKTGIVYINTINQKYADDFIEFYNKLLDS